MPRRGAWTSLCIAWVCCLFSHTPVQAQGLLPHWLRPNPPAPSPSTTPRTTGPAAAPSASGGNSTSAAAPVAPWANKLFLPDIALHREQAPPPVIVHDFGEVPHGTVCLHRFTITNIYDVPLQITEVRKSCHCLDYVPMTKVLQPNESAEFVVTMNTGKFVGFNAQTLYVTFGPRYVSTAILRLQATSRTDVSLQPGAIQFGVVPPGTRVVQRVLIKYSGRNRDWKLTEVVAPSPALGASLTEVSRGGLLRGGVEYHVDVVLQAGTEPGPLNETVYVKTNDPAQPVLRIAVSAVIAAVVECSPAQVQFDPVPLGQSATQRVLVRAARPFRILGVEGEGQGVSVELPPGNNPLPVQFVTVKFSPSQAGTIQRTLRLLTDLDGTAVSLPLSAKGISR
ncbi:DUF1573 domain-containing protein [Thermogemmata fonticola]|uniref:DUF1573 domain-containing protein n=1 Tax=Thermogemmata fonticola TaxID=2755323 RepID=A0A7V8VD89_9BACT|nr:DUF1573 domain-containing protein [Thermogemmata fonticola]MBA2225885.1 DUF1573 domain-containing protein [Thermogemmata fonticola]